MGRVVEARPAIYIHIYKELPKGTRRVGRLRGGRQLKLGGGSGGRFKKAWGGDVSWSEASEQWEAFKHGEVSSTEAFERWDVGGVVQSQF